MTAARGGSGDAAGLAFCQDDTRPIAMAGAIGSGSGGGNRFFVRRIVFFVFGMVKVGFRSGERMGVVLCTMKFKWNVEN